VFERLSQITGKPRSQHTIFLLVDGLQELDHTANSRNSVFARVLNAIATLVNAAPEFVIGCVAATVYQPVVDLLHDSPQLRCYLEPPPVRGHEVVVSADPLIRSLVDDMGGHGRALEALYEQVRSRSPLACL
jgi:hypothetical protein